MALGAWPPSASAQSFRPSPYVFGGWSLEVRDAESGPSVFNGITFGAGIALKREISIEGSVASYAADSINWYFGYISGPNGEKLTENRDVLVTGSVRWSQPCVRRLCTDVVAGGGFNSHVISTEALTACPPSTILGPCVQTNRPEVEGDHSEYMVIGGMDVRVRLNDRLTLLPGVRLGYLWRDEPLTGYGFRGPDEPEGGVVSFNITAAYRFK